MAQMKRPAEKATSNRGKRPRTSKKNDIPPSPEKEYQDAQDAIDYDFAGAEEEMAESITKTVRNFKKHSDSKKKRASQFEEEVNAQYAGLHQRVEQAENKIKDNRRAFKESMLPILASAIQDLDLTADRPPEIEHPLVLEATEETPAALKASEVLMKSQVLIASYDVLKETHPSAPSTTQMVNTFNKDKEETMKAFQAAKKMTMNQLKMRLADKMGETSERFVLTDDEHHLARRIMKGGKGQGQSPGKASGAGLGPLLYDFGKVVGKMQNLVQ